MVVADIGHKTGLPHVQLWHAVLWLAVAVERMSLIVSVSLQRVRAAQQRQRPHAPSRGSNMPSGGCGRRTWRPPMLWGRRTWDGWWCWRAQDFGPMCGWNGGRWIGLWSLRTGPCSSSPCYGVLRDHLRFVGSVCRAVVVALYIKRAPVVFVEVTAEPRIPGQDVWPVVPSNMWEPEQAAVMCAAMRGHAAALPRALVAQASSNRPAASLAMLHCGLRARCWVIVAL